MEFIKIANSWFVTIVVFLAAVVTLVLVLRYRQAIARFIPEVRTELVRCSWPWNPEQTGVKKYKELIDSTVVVSVCSLLLAAYVSTFDFLIMRLVGLLVRF